MTTLSYEKKHDSLIIYCNWEQYEDFLTSVNAMKNKINGRECFMIPIAKEKELIKIINYLNVVNNGKSRHTQTKYHRECSDDEDDDDDVKTNKKTSRVDFFKSFGKKDFKKKEKKISSSEEDDDDDDDDEYSSSSYDTSSSDNFPSPRTPVKRSNYSNEQLYFMIEKIQRKISLIEKILEKKILHS
jgi:hypothetical protein